MPASAAAGRAVLAPPATTGGSDATTIELRAPAGAVCSSENTITFSGIVLYRVRHLGTVECGVPTTIRCESKLLDLGSEPPEVVSSLRATGQRECSFDSGPSEALYELTRPFRERFVYRISLVRQSHVWGEPSDFCTRVSRDRKTLTCRARHETIAPIESKVDSG